MAAIRKLFGLAAAAVIFPSACASPEGGAANGAPCYRIEDCQEGLVCVKNVCAGLLRDGGASSQLKRIVGKSPLGPMAVDAGPPVVLGAGGVPGVGGAAATGGAGGVGGARAAGGTSGSAGGARGVGNGGAPGAGGSVSAGGSLGSGGGPGSGGAPKTDGG